MKLVVTTSPFDQNGLGLVGKLKDAGFSVRVNDFGRRLHPEEVASFIGDSEVVIAGTEPISARVLENCKEVKLISRVGIGLDSVDLAYCDRNKVAVFNTPDAPTSAVVELTIGVILMMIRQVFVASELMKGEKQWARLQGRCISECAIGILGFGRIGSKVAKILRTLGANIIYVNDIDSAVSQKAASEGYAAVSLDELLAKSDVLSIHCPLNESSKYLIGASQIKKMRNNSIIVNTARGGIVCENAILEDLRSVEGRLGSVYLDTFETEPYYGRLLEESKVFCSGHMGAMTSSSRKQMESEAVENVLNWFATREG